MHKIFLALILLSIPVSTNALAHSGTEQDENFVHRRAAFLSQSGGSRRFAVLACLKENRPKRSTACRQVLVSHGQ